MLAEPATKELVVLFKKLHDERQIDIRTLIPILNAMEKVYLNVARI